MRIGQIFKTYEVTAGCEILWMADKIVHEENREFKWDVVTAVWSAFGPMPIWAKEPRRFIFNRIRKSDGFRYC